MGKKAYSAAEVNKIDLGRVLAGREGQAVYAGIDVGKYELAVVVHWGGGGFERPWLVKNPWEIRLLVEMFKQVGQGRQMIVAMEPSGSYGDALRQAMADAGLVVHRIPPKIAHDYAEVFDGVPSQHDGKDAAVVAELARLGKGSVWRWSRGEDWEQELEYQVQRMEDARRLKQMWCGRLEGRLGRHWPEVIQRMKLESPMLLSALIEYGSPAALVADAAAKSKLLRWGGTTGRETAPWMIQVAGETVGVRMEQWEMQQMREYAQWALEARNEQRKAYKRVKQLAKARDRIVEMGKVVGLVTAAVVWVCLGDPKKYHCGMAYVKAMGLNLAERSSGVHKGKLKISKRGFGMVRYWMYMAALRWAKSEPVRPWQKAKRLRDGGIGGKALVGTMRRLALALWAVGNGQKFEAARLFKKLDQKLEKMF